MCYFFFFIFLNLAMEAIKAPIADYRIYWVVSVLNTYILIIHLFHELSASVLELQDV